MPMQIHNKINVPSTADIINQLLGEVHFRIEIAIRLFPPPIQIPPTQRASVVAVDDPIWIHHGYDFEHKPLPERHRSGIGANNKLNESFEYPTGDSLPGVRPRNNDDGRLFRTLVPTLLGILLPVLPIRYGQNFQPVSCQRPSQHFAMEEWQSLSLEVVQEGTEFGVGVGDAVGEVDVVLVVAEVVLKGQGVVVRNCGGLRPEGVVSETAHVVVGADPTLPLHLERPPAVGEDSHPFVVQPPRLPIVQDAEFRLGFGLVGDLEVEPIAIAVGIDIILQQKVVGSLGVFADKCEIPRLKPGIEAQVILHNQRLRLLGEEVHGHVGFAHLPNLVQGEDRQLEEAVDCGAVLIVDQVMPKVLQQQSSFLLHFSCLLSRQEQLLILGALFGQELCLDLK